MARKTLLLCDNCGDEMTQDMDSNHISWLAPLGQTTGSKGEVQEGLDFKVNNPNSTFRRDCETTDLCNVCYERALAAMLEVLDKTKCVSVES